MPGEGNRQRGEGVAIVLSGPAVSTWRAGGSQLKAWGSRLVTATLEIGKGRSGRLHILCCYAPTFAASGEEKNRFFDLLQDALSAILSEECYIILGDFNARVGSRTIGAVEWWYERVWRAERGWKGVVVLPLHKRSHCVQEVVSEEEDLEADLAAPQVTQVALYRLRDNEEGTSKEMPGCVCYAEGKL